ncbi:MULTISPECIES: cardiolipin synthase ClsB [Hydrogenophaga]|jgi:cardiolipin synthase|uniref:Cardiolipin synthase B n=1 Tax=Hydrogenophaga intermedia TaxID=65786 RepID=A0A1L1PMZ5_HYDIT|nr:MULTISPECIES: cardiolipin synthase ClsB [Hydrogenophaga]AOS80052.1 cardiolipin synthase B [Hydrogenophaga sp. PBC]CDN89089.1 Cardiolipin synthase 2 [Hydrogenophaga intermedia]
MNTAATAMNSRWLPGNRIELLCCGEDYYPSVFQAIDTAEKQVLLETFIWFDDPVGRELRAALIRAAQRGAEVHVLIDGWGSPDLGDEFVQGLIDAGVKLRAFEPVRKLFGARINMLGRMHNKLAVIDGRVAYVGGINYAKDHVLALDPEQAKLDYAVRIEGPLVEQIEAFCRTNISTPQPPREMWLRRWRRLRQLRREERMPSLDQGAVAAFVTRDNHRHTTDIERHYRAAIRSAQTRIVIANAYFFPGYRLVRDLRRAARRGVQVDLILQGNPDMPWVQRATMLLYEHLLRAGVRIHEYNERPLHAKVAVIDDHWATVGSSNLDPTSLSLNLEANVIVRDNAFAAVLRQALDGVLEKSCDAVQVSRPGRLRSAWIVLRSMVVFHALRRFPAWARWAHHAKPRVVPVVPESGEAETMSREAVPHEPVPHEPAHAEGLR